MRNSKLFLTFFLIFSHFGLLCAQDLTLTSTGSANQYNLTWSEAGVIEESTNLLSWTAQPSYTSPHVVDASNPSKKFFRLRYFADTVIRNAEVRTITTALPQTEAVAIKNGYFIYVGSDSGVTPYIGPSTTLIDAGGRVLMPGFQDVHMHAVEAGINADFSAFTQFGTEAQYRLELQQALIDQPGTGWVVGSGVNMTNLLDTVSDPLALINSEISSRPVVILDDLGHGAWANSLALQAVGFDVLIGDPQGGKIIRDTGGNPLGVVLENAGQTLIDAAFPATAANIEA